MDAALVFPFDEAFSRQPAEALIQRLQSGFGRISGICVGSGFGFGHRRSGNVESLTQMGRESDSGCRVFHHCSWGEVISSSRVRERIAAGI